MNKTIAVVYRSKYGSTRQYAQWVAEALGAELFESKQITPERLQSYDVVVHGGGLYAGGVAGLKQVAPHARKALVLFTVGAADPKITDYSDILGKNLTPEQLARCKAFHLRGDLDYTQMSKLHRMLMWMMKKTIEKKPAAQRDESDRVFLETYGGTVKLLDKAAIEPLVAYVRGLA